MDKKLYITKIAFIIITTLIINACGSTKTSTTVDPTFTIKGKLSDGVTIEDIMSKRKKENKTDSIYSQTPPLLPECENLATIEEQKNCLNRSLRRLVAKKFNQGLFDNAPKGIHKIYCFFIITEEGKIDKIETFGNYKKDEEEAYRVISDFPQFKAGTINGKKVSVNYTIPITFNVD